MKILLAVDGSRHTKKMLAYLVTHEELFSPNNQFTLLSVQTPLPSRARAAVGKEVIDGYYREASESVLRPASQFLLRHQINAKSLAKTGHAGDWICKTAATGKFDLIMMGSHGHGTFGNLVLGSVATQVLSHSKVPVLLVR